MKGAAATYTHKHKPLYHKPFVVATLAALTVGHSNNVKDKWVWLFLYP